MDPNARRDWLELFQSGQLDPDVPDLGKSGSGSDAVWASAPETRQRLQRVHEVDQAIRAALWKVPVPPQLGKRVLATLQRRERQRVRRWLLAGAGAAAAGFAAFWFWPRSLYQGWTLDTVGLAAIELCLEPLAMRPFAPPPEPDWPPEYHSDYIDSTAAVPKFLGVVIQGTLYRLRREGQQAFLLTLPKAYLGDDFPYNAPFTGSTEDAHGLTAYVFPNQKYACIAVVERLHHLDLFTTASQMA